MFVKKNSHVFANFRDFAKIQQNDGNFAKFRKIFEVKWYLLSQSNDKKPLDWLLNDSRCKKSVFDIFDWLQEIENKHVF